MTPGKKHPRNLSTSVHTERIGEQLVRANAEHPGPEGAHIRAAVSAAGARYFVDADGTLDAVARELAEAKVRYEAATSAARTVVRLAVEDGASELGLAGRLGINRLTVRKYRGKVDRRS